MLLYRSVVFCGLVLQVWGTDYAFPDDFEFGTATAAFQIEGAWNVSEKSPSIWDNYLHTNASRDNGDVTCDSYHLWETDIENLSKLGVKFYRFSISWTRLLPSGFANHISKDGQRYYNNLIDGLLEKGIKPVATLYHWDLPQTLQDLGGWANPDIADWVAEYARVAYSLFADRVKTWITLNEPYTFCLTGYNLGIHPPSVALPGIADYICIKNVLIAHAKAWRIYDKEFRSKYNGKASISNHLLWIEAESDDKDSEIAETLRQFNVGLFSHAIYSKEGGWPPGVEQIVAKNSAKEGYPRSRLPSFTKQEINLIKGTYDFYGMNHYTSRTARQAVSGETVSIGIGTAEVNAVVSVRAGWKRAGPFWFYVCYECMRKQLAWLKKNYGDVEILITENGYGDDSGLDLSDDIRIEFMTRILKQILLSIHEDKVNVVGYTAWSLMDNLEWTSGFQSRFGLYQIDFTDPERRRTARASANFYADLVSNRRLSLNDTSDDD